MRTLLLNIFTLLYFVNCSWAQPLLERGEDDDPYEGVSYCMYGVNYLSNNVYLGRKDTAVVPYLSPYAGYHLKSGLYAKGSVSFSRGNNLRPDLATLEAGYDRSFGRVDCGVSLYKYFYHKNSLNTRANILGSACVYAQYCNDWIQPQVVVDVNLNKKNVDFVTNISLDHDFELKDGSLHIVPTIAMNMGTQYFLDDYFVNRLTQADKNLKLKKAIVDAGKYKPLDYEFSVKATFRASKWLFTAMPVYVVAVNPGSVALPKGTVVETLSNSFYVELDICHR
jgi:hypothetical protein